MVGPTAQLVALACHVNARARGLLVSTFFPGHSTCRFCEYVRFLRRRRRLLGADRWEVVASTPDAWMGTVVASGVTEARVEYRSANDPRISDRVSAAFAGGGGQWSLLVRRDHTWDRWQSRWEVGDQNAAERRIWRVEYGLVSEGEPSAPGGRSLGVVIADLDAVLVEIEAFARENDLRGFAEQFQSARECLAGEGPAAHHEDLAPDGVLGPPALRLLAACQAAWVFGGMGSWNDLGFDEGPQRVYDRLSGALYGLVNEGICVAANESGGARGSSRSP